MSTLQAIPNLVAENETSFFDFIYRNYRLSKFVLPHEKPKDDSLDVELKEILSNLIEENDYYEVNTIIKRRYSVTT